MTITMKQLKEEGATFTEELNGKVYHALVLWGPHTGFWSCPSMSRRITRQKSTLKTTYAKHIKLSVCFTMDEYNLAKKLNSRVYQTGRTYEANTQHAKAIMAKVYNEALSKVPEWALKEIRRWSPENRMNIARFLSFTGPEGIQLLQDERDWNYWICLFNMLDSMGRPKSAVKFHKPWKRKRLIRSLFPRSTAQSRNQLIEELNLSNRSVKRYKKLKFTSTSSAMLVQLIGEYGKKRRLNPYQWVMGNRMEDPTHHNKCCEMMWDWPKVHGEHPNHMLGGIRRMSEQFGLNYLYEEALQANTYNQLNRIHEQLRHRQRVDDEERRRDYNAWAKKRDQDLMKRAWPIWDRGLPEGVLHLNSYELVVKEGDKMQHCIGGYARTAFSEGCWLFHIIHQGQEASLMVNRDKRTIVQMYGKCNTPVSEEMQKYVRDWLKS